MARGAVEGERRGGAGEEGKERVEGDEREELEEAAWWGHGGNQAER